jgi:hypothetical protein
MLDGEMTTLADKSEIAELLAEAHCKFEPAINRIVRVIADEEGASNEPVKLLEVNPDTSPSGIVPIAFGPDPPQVPFPSVVIEVTEAEFEKIQSGTLLLPHGWRLDKLLYPSAA